MTMARAGPLLGPAEETLDIKLNDGIGAGWAPAIA